MKQNDNKKQYQPNPYQTTCKTNPLPNQTNNEPQSNAYHCDQHILRTPVVRRYLHPGDRAPHPILTMPSHIQADPLLQPNVVAFW